MRVAKMRRHALTLSFLMFGCTRQEAAVLPWPEVTPPPPPPPAEAVFARCYIDCSFDFTALRAGRVTVVQGYCHNAEPQCIEFVGELTEQARVRFSALEKELAGAGLKEDYGCGVCVDGNDYTVKLTGGRSYHYPPFRDAALPEPAVRANGLFMSLHKSAHACASGQLVRFGADCTPFEAIKPAPFTRP